MPDPTPDPIPLTQPRLDDDDIVAAVRVLRSGHLVQGLEVAAFEAEFAALVDQRHCVAVNSGTSALWLSLLALGIGPGDEVVLPAFTFGATAAAVRLTGAACVFADIDPDTFCLDPAAAEAALTPRTAAIIPVHLYGHPAAMNRFTSLADRHGLALIEDTAQAHAAALDGHPAGGFGTTGAFSFYPTKNMQAIEGGLITTADTVLAHRLRLLRNHGMQTRHHHEIIGTNARMNDVSAAIARTQLRKLPDRTRARRRNATRLDHALIDLPGILTPPVAAGAHHVYHQYTLRVLDGGPAGRDAFALALRRAGIDTAVHYPIGLHRSPAHHTPVELPHTDTAGAQVVSLPVHPALTDAQLDRIIAAAATGTELVA